MDTRSTATIFPFLFPLDVQKDFEDSTMYILPSSYLYSILCCRALRCYSLRFASALYSPPPLFRCPRRPAELFEAEAGFAHYHFHL